MRRRTTTKPTVSSLSTTIIIISVSLPHAEQTNLIAANLCFTGALSVWWAREGEIFLLFNRSTFHISVLGSKKAWPGLSVGQVDNEN